MNSGDPTPAYAQIANRLRGQIQRGELQHGDQLPSQRELIANSGSAPGTVQRAIAQLESEGLVVKVQGRGTFVRHPRRMLRDGSTRHKPNERPSGTAPMEAEAGIQNFQQDQIVAGAGMVNAPAVVAERLGVREGMPVFARRFLLTLDDEPAQTAVSYFSQELADDPVLQLPQKVPGGTHQYLKAELGMPLHHATEVLVARMPTPEEIGDLRLVPGTPVVELIRTIYTRDGVPVEVTVFVCAGDRYEFKYTVPMD